MGVKISYTYSLDADAIRRFCEERGWGDDEIKALLEDEEALQSLFGQVDLSDIDELGTVEINVEVE